VVTVTGIGEVNNMIFGWIEQITPGVAGCENITGYLNPYFVAAGCVQGSYVTACMPAGTYYLWAGTDFSNIDPCPADYVMTVACTPCSARVQPANNLCQNAPEIDATFSQMALARPSARR
jgi:hypothetical protein